MKLIFATNNQHKVAEIQKLLPSNINVLSLKEAGIDIDIPEPHNTLAENAEEKSNTIHQLTDENCFSEDTGLFVDALNGDPGVKSARYAGPACNADDNIQKLLHQLGNTTQRSARFKTVISLIINEKKYLFEGVCEGSITYDKQGEKGFGYDPVFMPNGSSKTFGNMNSEEKSVFSHRAKAVEKLIQFLSGN